MGIYDRDYTQADSQMGKGYKRMGNFMMPAPGWLSMVGILMMINLAVFVLDKMLFNFGHVGVNFHNAYAMPPLEYWGHFSTALGFEKFQIWRVISFQFLHADVMHIFLNMLGLFFLGPMIEQYLGSKRFLAYYLICGVGGAIFYLFMGKLGIIDTQGILPVKGAIPLIGASAGVFGVMAAAARVAPNTQVLVMFIIPVKLRIVIWFALAYAALTLLNKGNNAGGEAAHLGGAILGFALIAKPSLLNFADRFGPSRNKPSLAQRTRQWQSQRQEQAQTNLDASVDEILDKVKNHGIQSLSDKEKRILQKATHQQRRS